MDHIKKHQEEIKGRIYGSYNIEKSNEDELEKGGEGSKGGQVIGHTKSGKPIYDRATHHEHQYFSKEDHKEAAALHKEHANRASTNALRGGTQHAQDKADYHRTQAANHERFSKRAKIERTKD